MGGGVSSLPAEVSLAEAKELAGAKWQPAWEEKFAEAKISRDEAIQCWKESEAKAAISGALYEKLHGSNRSGVAEALDFSAIVNEKRGQHLPGTREWVFEAVLRWRTDADSAKLFWLVGGGGTGKSFDWDVGAEVQRNAPFILAGGLRPEQQHERRPRVRSVGVRHTAECEAQPRVDSCYEVVLERVAGKKYSE